MSKRVHCLLIAVFMALGLYGCKKEVDVSSDVPTFTEIVKVTEPVAETEAEPSEVSETTAETTVTIVSEETEPVEIKTNTEATQPSNTASIAVHFHKWNHRITTPTCTAAGYITHTCSCGATEVDSKVAAKGHNWGPWNTVKEATETAAGQAKRVCSTCKASEIRVLDKLPSSHKHSYTGTVTKVSSCLITGEKIFKCTCGDSYTEDIAKLAHKYSSRKVTATCTERGYTVHTCSVCGDSYHDNYTDVLKHNYKETVIKPTCTAEGYTSHKCTCGDSYIDSKVSSTGHSWGDWKATKEATETTAGTKERTCSTCKTKETSAIPKLTHTHKYTDAITKPTCTTEGYTNHKCACGDSYVDNRVSSTGHSWGAWKTTKEATEISKGTKERACSTCKTKETGAIPKLTHTHKYTDIITKPTCTTDGYTTHMCACGDSYVDSKVASSSHSWGEWNVVKEATTTSTGSKERTCSTCKTKDAADIPMVTHSHSYTSVVTKSTCTADGYTTYTCTCGNSYVGNKVSSNGHSYIHTVTKPTCTTEGYTTHKCSKCKESYTDTKVSATGHSWSEWVTVINPTENSTGLARRTCNGCGDAATKTLDMVGHTHNYKITVDYKAPTCSAEGYETKACSCGDTSTTTIPMEHDWVTKHTSEIGHYEVRIVCHCGWSCSADIDYVSAFGAHVNSVDPETRYDHSYYDTSKWVIDVPAQNWQECSACGITK